MCDAARLREAFVRHWVRLVGVHNDEQGSDP